MAFAQGQPLIGLLLRVKMRSLMNRVRQAADEAPLRLFVAVVLVAVIWAGLYSLFHEIFRQINRTPLEATVAIPLVFNFFFVAMLALLTFSNAIISYGGLFGSDEAGYLLAAPLTPSDVVTLKYLESLLMASWSLILLGFPMVTAMATGTRTLAADQPYFYLLFPAFFLAFIPIPAALGLLMAYVGARYVPRSVIRVLSVAAGALIAVFMIWGLRSVQIGDAATETWLREFLARMSFVQASLLPNQWVAAGIDHALHGKISTSCLYLGVTAANAWFLSWIAVRVVSGGFSAAHDRATAGRDVSRRSASQASGGLSGRVFFYLPLPLRLIAAKDLRTFFRDPLQWSQLVILFGLLVLYLTNMPTLRVSFSGSRWFLIIPFLNLCAVSLILATFTCRFVFPLVSLEGQKLWLISLLPTQRRHILYAKFAFAMTITLLVAIGAMTLAAFMLQLDAVWAVIHLAVTVAICFGLCGFSVGIGARLPMFKQKNVARIASGLGGTTNLLASIALVSVVLGTVGYATWRTAELERDALPDAASLSLCAGAILLNLVAGTLALRVGAAHFERAEV